jgi:lysophospholipase L1-like esterase
MRSEQCVPKQFRSNNSSLAQRCALSLIVVCMMLWLNGCVVNPTSPTSPPVTTTTVTTNFATTTNFGDSITCGYYAMPNDGLGYMYSNEGYATVLDTGLNATTNAICRQGDMAADMARLWVYPSTSPALAKNALYTVLIGTNDAHFCGPSSGCISNWSLSLKASLAWLALPSTDKVLGTAMTKSSGTWAADTGVVSPTGAVSTAAVSTTNHGAKLSFSVTQTVASRSLYLAYRVFDPSAANGGAAQVSVDGGTATALNASTAGGQPIATQNSTTDTIFLATIPLGAVGKHTVTITTTSAEGAVFSVLWAGASSQTAPAKIGWPTASGAPIVAVGSITTTGQEQLNSWVASYNAALTPLVAGLVSDGMNIVIAPTGTALNADTDLVDLLHPANAGHAKLAAAFASVLATPTVPTT